MSEDRFERLVSTFSGVRRLQGTARKRRLTELSAGDLELLGEVESLLEHHDRVRPDFLSPPPRDRDLETPAEIGDYRIVEPLGEGGMGRVYLAEEKATGRRVALKVLRPEINSPEAVRRFAREVRVLARIDDPGIASIYAAGEFDAGAGAAPFFAMELIDGLPLTDFAEQHRLPTRERARLLRRLCAAVHAAHSVGVIHRDLKPSNVLVPAVTSGRIGDAQPKVLDFGIARDVEGGDSGATLATEEGQLIGSIPYMSPEQLSGEAQDLDARSDVYALGVVAFELLAGELPHDLTQLTSLAAVKKILEVEPRRLRSVMPRLRGDLDTIVGKALERERRRRYASAEDLAADLDRYLEHRPVLARPPGGLYLMSKLVRRHRLLAATALAVFLVLAVTLGIVLDRRAEGREHLAHFQLLSVGPEVDDARKEIAAFRPVTPENAGAVEAWLRERPAAFESARRELEVQRRRLRALAVSRVPPREAKSHPEYPRLEDLVGHEKKLVEDLGRLRETPPETSEAGEIAMFREAEAAQVVRLDEERASITRLRTRIEDRVGIRFESRVERSLHDALVAILSDVDEFLEPNRGEVAQLRRDLERVRSVQEHEASSTAAWKEALAAIAASDGAGASKLYRGLVIARQRGLVPLGPDPDSLLWEFADVRSGPVPARDPATGRLVYSNDPGIVFVLLPGGTFTMGAQSKDPAAAAHDPMAIPNEYPVHDVTLAPFFMAKHELTKGQWQRLVGGDEPSYWRYAEKPDDHWRMTWAYPVESVSWKECDALCRRHGYLLPTEAQWEYAARGGRTTRWWTGEERESLVGAVNIADASNRARGYKWRASLEWPELDDGYSTLAPVTSLRANPFGLHHVLGNVTEWCRDERRSYSTSPRAGDGFRGAGPRLRIARGGHINKGVDAARHSKRHPLKPSFRRWWLGVRLSRSLDGLPEERP